MGGFPCVDVSTLTTTPGSVIDGSCSSGKGFLGVEEFARKRRPPLILIENVRSLFHKRKVELDGQSAQFHMNEWFPICSTFISWCEL